MVSRRLEKPVSLRYNACPMAIPAKDFVSLLQDVGFDFFTGVPDSTLGGIIATLIERRVYIPAVREDEAVGLAAGAYMGGRIPAVLMQNSGLGTSLNALISLNLIYLQPCLLLVSWRGHDGTDAPEHLVMGQVMTKLLDLVRSRARGRGLGRAGLHVATHPGRPAGSQGSLFVRPEEGVLTSRSRAIGAVLELLTDELVVVCNGLPSREVYALRDRPENFYMIGSMGLAPAIGLGVALAQPRRKVVVLDGDGNVLMAMGTLATVGALKPRNFVHIVFDNEVYGSTGNQPTLSQTVRLEQVAKAAGYRHVERVRELDDAVYEAKTMLKEDGPSFLLVKVSELAEDVGRVGIEPAAMTERFRKAAVGVGGAVA